MNWLTWLDGHQSLQSLLAFVSRLESRIGVPGRLSAVSRQAVSVLNLFSEPINKILMISNDGKSLAPVRFRFFTSKGMTIVAFLVDTSPSMAQVSYLGTSYLDFARQVVEQFLKV